MPYRNITEIAKNIAKNMEHLDHILELVDMLQHEQKIYHYETALRERERRIISDNIALIVETAKAVGDDLIANPIVSSPQSNIDACAKRYIYVPILYKLGFSAEAAELGQITFEYLFPQLHMIILRRLRHFFNGDFAQLQEEVMKIFSINNPNILRIYSRVKSTNAIWKKIEDIKKIELMDLDEFINCVDDLIALRWNMRINSNENHYDALLNAIPYLPCDSVLRFRNQQIFQQSGFSCEPVFKFYYRVKNIPVEVQLLGGFLESYLSAKGYANYKVGCRLGGGDLTVEQQNARLGLCIYYAEQGQILEFRKMMLRELTQREKMYYDVSHVFILNSAPLNPDNLTLSFVGSNQPIYLLDQHNFHSNRMSLKK